MKSEQRNTMHGVIVVKGTGVGLCVRGEEQGRCARHRAQVAAGPVVLPHTLMSSSSWPVALDPGAPSPSRFTHTPSSAAPYLPRQPPTPRYLCSSTPVPVQQHPGAQAQLPPLVSHTVCEVFLPGLTPHSLRPANTTTFGPSGHLHTCPARLLYNPTNSPALR